MHKTDKNDKTKSNIRQTDRRREQSACLSQCHFSCSYTGTLLVCLICYSHKCYGRRKIMSSPAKSYDFRFCKKFLDYVVRCLWTSRTAPVRRPCGACKGTARSPYGLISIVRAPHDDCTVTDGVRAASINTVRNLTNLNRTLRRLWALQHWHMQ